MMNDFSDYPPFYYGLVRLDGRGGVNEPCPCDREYSLLFGNENCEKLFFKRRQRKTFFGVERFAYLTEITNKKSLKLQYKKQEIFHAKRLSKKYIEKKHHQGQSLSSTLIQDFPQSLELLTNTGEPWYRIQD